MSRNIRGFSPLMLAASSDTIPAGVVKLLLAKGADTSFKGDYDETARDLAAKRGDTDVTRLLGGMPPGPARRADGRARPGHAAAIHPGRGGTGARDDRKAKLQLHPHRRLQLVPLAGSAVRRGRLCAQPRIDGAREIPQLPHSMMPPAERLMDLNIVTVASMAWELFDFGMNGVPKNAYTDAAVRVIKAMQTPQGNWSANESRRPPMTAGEFQAAALAIYAIKHYTPAGDEARARAGDC